MSSEQHPDTTRPGPLLPPPHSGDLVSERPVDEPTNEPGHAQTPSALRPPTWKAPTTGSAPDTGRVPTTGRAPTTGSAPDTGREPPTGRAPTTGSAPDTGREPPSWRAPDTGREPTTGRAPDTGREPPSWRAPDERSGTERPADPADAAPASQPTAASGTLDASDDRVHELTDLLDGDGTAVATLGLDGHVHTVNRTFLAVVGASAIDELRPGAAAFGVLRSLLDHIPNELTDGERRGIWYGDVDHHVPSAAADPSGTHTGGEHSGSATTRVLRSTVAVVPPSPDAPAGRLSILLHDVTDERDEHAQLRHRATHDPLTGLANRHHVLGHLARAIGEHRDRPGHVAALAIDLDHLKYVNDAFGHRAGDRLLASTASRLNQLVRSRDRVARIGGDEFLVVGTGLADATTTLELAERIRRALSGHLEIAELDLDFSVSIGIALTDAEVLRHADTDAAELLVSDADTAMSAAKRSGRGRCTLHTSRMRAAARDRTEVAATLARAVIDETLTVEYQPVFSTVTGLAVGAEAQVRWFHPRLGSTDAATFIAVAEESGTIGRLGGQVLVRALDDLVRWRSAGRVDDDFVVHVNVSRVQLASTTFVDTVTSMLQERRLRPHQLVLGTRETPLLGRTAEVDRSIRALRRFGVQIAVDDFGTGPTALSVMTDVGADVLRLDGSLALPAASSETDTRLVRAVVLLAHALDMDVLAERISSPEQLHRLRAAGCDRAQGDLLARPAAAADLDVTEPHGW